jgi:hypothetical protein
VPKREREKKKKKKIVRITFVPTFLDTNVAKQLAACFSEVRVTAQNTIDILPCHRSDNVKCHNTCFVVYLTMISKTKHPKESNDSGDA